MSKRKICVVTGTRAEFGLLKWLMKEVQQDPNLELQVIATGMHLSPEFGLTHTAITEWGIKVNKKIEVLLSSDTGLGIAKSMGLGLISYADALADLQPDILVVLGDRYEIFAVVSAAMPMRIPVAHIHGGELTEGLIDEAIRHSITKMSHLHFTATEAYRKRVIQLGEQPERVYNVGAPGLDGINSIQLLGTGDLEKELGMQFRSQLFLITFHPVTLENSSSERQMMQLLSSLDNFLEASVIFTFPNSDTDGRIIADLIKQYENKNPKRVKSFVSLGQLRYLSALRHADLVIGNSSSGLIEAPSFKVPTINIGDRQKGRIKAKSVIDCEPEEESISGAISKGLSTEFKKGIQGMSNPYGQPGASTKIKEKLATVNLNGIIKKTFFDIE